jgi:hypothetical protein
LRPHFAHFLKKWGFSVRHYLTGLETILTADANAELSEKDVLHPQKVNHAVSFNAIKNEAFALLGGKERADVVLQKLERLFLMSPTCQRSERDIPRQKRSDNHLLNYQKRSRKICF